MVHECIWTRDQLLPNTYLLTIHTRHVPLSYYFVRRKMEHSVIPANMQNNVSIFKESESALKHLISKHRANRLSVSHCLWMPTSWKINKKTYASHLHHPSISISQVSEESSPSNSSWKICPITDVTVITLRCPVGGKTSGVFFFSSKPEKRSGTNNRSYC